MTIVKQTIADSQDVLAIKQPVANSGIVHLCNGLDPIRDGGMVPSILGMTGALAELGEKKTSVFTTTPSRRELLQIPPNLGLFGPEHDFRSAVRNAEVVHMHGLWQIQTRVGSREALRHGVPYIIAAHGMAEPWAMKQKALKKKIYFGLVERHCLRNASCLHALTRPECQFLKKLAPKTPVAWIPNGVGLEPFDRMPDRSTVHEHFPQIKGKFTLLFLSRLHVKKGLDMLADSLARTWGKKDDWHLLLAGTEDGAGTAFEDQMKSLGLASHVTRVGHVSGEKAKMMWSAADAFVLPSRSEGFSMAVLESLAARVPTIITTACHFPELGNAQGGIVCEPHVDAISKSLDLIKSGMNLKDRQNMAEAGRKLVEQKYTWAAQAERLMELYKWVQQGGVRPEFVV